ncbi:MAG: TRAP transporter substrate-binding protein DctP [Acetobacteraceae bacterium]|nr:TRAP transporter substrate-binding protein DctP [Acetobacteraceae bacterium]MCX7683794.1 TRAP transporter substrate-binding protein DctP [Acetobacteraceae bacterium]MDW8398929.1 TRAP transporter substrate-binding protein DctP [Acetobacteraceae bacterium]
MSLARRSALAAALAAPAVSTSGALAQQPIRLRMTTIVPAGTYLFTAYSQRFADAVRDATDGRVVVQPFAAGVLAPPFEVYRAVEDGRADAGHAPPALIYQRDPTMALVTSFPGGLGVEATLHWLYAGEGEQFLEAHHRDRFGLVPLVAGAATTEIFAHSWRPIRTAADLRGMKFRTLGVWAELLRGFGAEPMATPTAEVATVLERRVIDAAKMAAPSDNVQMGLHRIAPYVVIPGAHLPGGYFTVFLRAQRWDSIPDPLKAAIRAAARRTTFDSYVEKGMMDIAAMEEIRRGRAELITLDPGFIREIREAGRAWAAQAAAAATAAGNPWTARAAEQVFRFQDRWEAGAVYRL